MKTLTEKRAAFRKLHESGCFVLPNPWDVGSAIMFQHLGFKAVASTSAGFAWSIGRPDNQVTVDDVLKHLREICQAIDIPVNADFESGFAKDTETLYRNVQSAVEAGVAGLSIEDQICGGNGLYDSKTAIERVKAARKAIDDTKVDVILVARTERLLSNPSEVSAAIDSLVSFAEAGADCLYAPGPLSKESIKAMVKAVAPKPINVLTLGLDMTVNELEELGVRRISTGSALAKCGWNAIVKTSKDILAGNLSTVQQTGVTYAELNKVFTEHSSAKC